MMASGVQADGNVRDWISSISSRGSLTATHDLRGSLPVKLRTTCLPDGDEELRNRVGSQNSRKKVRISILTLLSHSGVQTITMVMISEIG
jgi:hypothetical protein